MDPVGWYIAVLHGLLGHAAAARIIEGSPVPEDPAADCLLCLFEDNPTEGARQRVIQAIGHTATQITPET